MLLPPKVKVMRSMKIKSLQTYHYISFHNKFSDVLDHLKITYTQINAGKNFIEEKLWIT